MDNIDRHILSRLATDGRYKNTQLAIELSLSEAAVRTRIKHLQESGALQIVALCNPLIMGHRGVRLLIDVTEDSARNVVESLKKIGQINQLSLLDNSRAIYMDITCRDLDQLMDVLEFIRTVRGIIRIRPFVLTRLYKDYSWEGLVGSKGQKPDN